MDDYYQPGKSYIVCNTFGWVLIGRFVRRLDWFNNLFEDVSYIRNAGCTWPELLANGKNGNTAFETFPVQQMPVSNQSLWVAEWPHDLPKRKK